MPLHPIAKAIRNYRLATGFMPPYTMTLAEAREADRVTEAGTWDWIEPPEDVSDLDIDGPGGALALRVYRPRNESGTPLPVLVYFFGGGFVVGSLQTSDTICRALSGMVPCVVVAVGYRLAPEHPYPAAVEDCYAAVRWVTENAARLGADGARVAVGGDSNGGTLAAAISHLARDEGGPSIAAQLLIYPATQHGSATRSMRDNDDPMFFNARSTLWFWDLYLADPADGASPYASPLNATDHGGLPPALMITAEFCPLLDEGEAYANALARAGTPTEYHRYPDLPHGFLAMAAVLDVARDALEVITEFLRRQLYADKLVHAHGPDRREVPGE